MCGLCGFVGFFNNEELAHLANKTQAHRGPDSQAVWSDSHLALGHQRLSIIDLSDRANQPLEKEELIIVFNGEIYNYKEIKELLIKNYNATFKTESDTEVVLEAYRYMKEKALELFVGMFAFAIYNKNDKSLFIARDHFGIKPLFYTFIGSSFAFASELKTLVNTPGFNKKINYKSLVTSLNYLFVSGNESMFEGCFKLPPAHYMIVKENLEYSTHSYWKLEEKLTNKSEEEYISELSKEVNEAIERHMVADVPVSSFLSGGLDSSLISVLAQKYNKELATYTIGTEEKDKKIEQMPEDEKYAKELAKLHNFNYNEIIISADIIDTLPKIVRTLDEPIGDPAAINTFLICQAARNKGCKVLLSGMGADEIFFGYRKHKAMLYALMYQSLPMSLRETISSLVDQLPVKTNKFGLKFVRWAKRFLTFANLPVEQAFMRSYSYYDKDELVKLFKNEHKEEIEQIYVDHTNTFNTSFKKDPINQMCQTDIKIFMLDLNLTYSDRASMAASVEVRVPYIDKKLIEYAMTIPGKFKFKENQSKYILKKVSEAYLPQSIIYRPKAAFGAPIRSWISNDLRPMIDDLLSKENVEKRGIFDYNYIKQIIDEDRKGISDNAYRIYQLITIELWFREFVDSKVSVTDRETVSV